MPVRVVFVLRVQSGTAQAACLLCWISCCAGSTVCSDAEVHVLMTLDSST